MLDVKRLRVLREVANQGSFSAAAEALAYTQSAVSQQIAALEKETGATLVERGSRGIRLTDAGRALVEHADGILARLAAAEAELDAIAGLRGGRVRLATFPTAGAALVPYAVASFSKRHPGVELTLAEAEPEQALPLLKSGEFDVALIFEYTTAGGGKGARYEGLDLVHLLDDPMNVALPAGHPLASVRRSSSGISPARRGCRATAWASAGGCTWPRATRPASSRAWASSRRTTTSVQGLVAAGVAVSLIPELALTNLRDDIVVRPITPQAPVRRVAAATLQNGYRSPATAAMLEVLQEAAQAYLANRCTLQAAS